MSDVVVIIPALNAAGTLARQLRALDAQTDLGFKVVVSDNGSSDDTARIAQEWQPQFTSLEVIDASARRGVASARNIAIEATDQDLILICDADDEVRPSWVEAMRGALRTHAAATGPLHLVWTDDPSRSEIWNASEVPVSMGYRPYMPGCNIGMRRSVFDEVGGFDASLDRGQEDVDFGWKLTGKGYEIGHALGAVVDYYQREGLRNFLRQQWRYGKAHVALYLRHKDAPIRTADWKTSLRWFFEWAKQMPRRIRNREARAALGGAVFQLARCSESIRYRVATPL